MKKLSWAEEHTFQFWTLVFVVGLFPVWFPVLVTMLDFYGFVDW